MRKIIDMKNNNVSIRINMGDFKVHNNFDENGVFIKRRIFDSVEDLAKYNSDNRISAGRGSKTV